VSNHSRRGIASHFSIDGDSIAVVSEAAAPVFRHLPAAEESFILAVGGISPNKNLGVLIRALPAWRATRPGVRLVLVGDYKKDGFQSCYAELLEVAARCGVTAHVEFAGFVPDEELVAMYNRCLLFVMPSLEEGFGLPLAEALACGCACVVASGHSLEEVGGDAVALADPHSQAEWEDVVARLLGDDAGRVEFRRKALERTGTFTWERGARTLAAVFEELLYP
jgi:glycosyltransferase involved in cell wall biosynthesis